MKIIPVKLFQLKQLKKFRLERESNPWPMRYRCSVLTNWAIKPSGSWSIESSYLARRWRNEREYIWNNDLHIILSLSAVQIYQWLFHAYSCSFLQLRDKYELSIDQLPIGLIAQLVRALHRYRRGHGFDSRSSLNFFRFLLFSCLSWNTFTAMIFI